MASLSALGGKNGWAESGYGLSQSGARLVSVVRISEAKEVRFLEVSNDIVLVSIRS